MIKLLRSFLKQLNIYVMEFIDVLGLVAGACTTSSLVPQLVTTLKLKKAQDVSILMFIIMLTGNALWTYFGVVKSELSIIITNVLALLLNAVLIVLKIKYSKNNVSK
jgi:MtN3 and saliva related transmembrane protein